MVEEELAASRNEEKVTRVGHNHRWLDLRALSLKLEIRLFVLKFDST